jgi:hypothetical protein
MAATNAAVRDGADLDPHHGRIIRIAGRITRIARERGPALFTALSPVQFGDAAHPVPAVRVFHLHDLGLWPVEIVRDEGYLLADLIEGVANYSPAAAASIRNAC